MGPNIYDVHVEKGWVGPEIFHMFTDSIYCFHTTHPLFIFADGGGGGGGC